MSWFGFGAASCPEEDLLASNLSSPDIADIPAHLPPVDLHLTAAEKDHAQGLCEAMGYNMLAIPGGVVAAQLAQRASGIRSPFLPIISRAVVSLSAGLILAPMATTAAFVEPRLRAPELRLVRMKTMNATCQICQRDSARDQAQAQTWHQHQHSAGLGDRDTVASALAATVIATAFLMFDESESYYWKAFADEPILTLPGWEWLAGKGPPPVPDLASNEINFGSVDAAVYVDESFEPVPVLDTNLTLRDCRNVGAVWYATLSSGDGRPGSEKAGADLLAFTSEEIEQYPGLADMEEVKMKLEEAVMRFIKEV